MVWWEKCPGRLEYELAALTGSGIRYEIDKQARKDGKIILHIWPLVNGEAIELVVKFPDNYPYFRFEADAPQLTLTHHQNPVGKNLCLLGRGTANWNPSDTVASLMSSQLKNVIASGSTEDRCIVAGIEEHQAEPLSEYCSCYPGSMILVDSSWVIPPEIETGWMEVGLVPGVSFDDPLRGAVLSILDKSKNSIASCPANWSQLYPHKIKVKYLRIDDGIPAFDPRGIADYISANYPHMAKYIWHQVNGGKISVTGIIFKEEVEYGKPKADSWIFLVLRHKGKYIQKNKNGQPTNIYAYLSRAGRAGITDHFSRIPELSPLHDKKVAVVGLGCIGSPSVIEFAKAGVGELRILDHDTVRPGNFCRWPLGNQYLGWYKSEALKHHIESNFIHTKVKEEHFRIGDPNLAGLESQKISELLEDIDLVYDATAEPGVQYFLADLCAEVKVPLIITESRHGGFGGLVARLRPHTGTGCYLCLKKAQDEGSLPTPPLFDDETFVQPIGCADPTFTAAGFDTSEISLAGVRMAVSTLCEGNIGYYPITEHDVGILHLRDREGNLIFPKWEHFKLPNDPNCACAKCKD